MRINVKSLIEEKFPPTNRARNSKRKANINAFAKAIETDPNSAGKIYDGELSSINFSTLENICRVLECTPLDIFESDDLKVIRLIQFQKRANNKDDTE